MTNDLMSAIIYFLITLIISAIIIYALASFFLGGETIAIPSLYDMGWLKAIITSVFVWILALLVGMILPTLEGPFYSLKREVK